MKPLLSLRNVSKVYANGFRALSKIDFDIGEGEFVVVLGLSGSGKSTLLREIRERSPVPAAMIFQQFNLIERHSVFRNVLYGALGRTSTFASLFGRFAEADRVKARESLELVGISEKADSRVSELSGGQKQRVAIARALLQGARLILADEPVASLDPVTARSVLDSLDRTRKLGVTVVCSLHDLALAQKYATRIIALKSGEKIFEGVPGSVPAALNKIYGGGFGPVSL